MKGFDTRITQFFKINHTLNCLDFKFIILFNLKLVRFIEIFLSISKFNLNKEGA